MALVAFARATSKTRASLALLPVMRGTGAICPPGRSDSGCAGTVTLSMTGWNSSARCSMIDVSSS